MTGPLPGSPEALAGAADVLGRSAEHLEGFRRDVGVPVRAAFGDWRGTAAPVALARLDEDLDVLTRAVDVCRLVAAVLRTFAEDLGRAQRDAAEGEALAATDVEMGARVVESAATLTFAADDAARAVRDATSLLPAPMPVDVEGGNALDGLRKAGGDVLDELGSTLSGALDHVNPFSDRFGAAWAETGATAAAVATDPMAALDTVAQGITAPIAESYRTGGVDEAAARGAGTIAAALLGGKGLTKLGTVVPDSPPAPSGIRPPEFTRPQTRLVPGGGLQRHEEHGGHALAPGKAHVGAPDQQLLDRQAREKRPIPVSTYTDRQTAENAISETMRRNKVAIDAWLHDPSRRDVQGFDTDHRAPIGRSARSGATLTDVVDVSSSRVVLRRDPSAPDGYYILTSYPRT